MLGQARWRATAGQNHTAFKHEPREGMGACLAVEGSINAVVFETYIEKVHTPTLEPGQIVVMDNLCAHKGQRGSKNLPRSRGASPVVPAAVLLAGLQPSRGSLRQDQEHPEKSRGSRTPVKH